MDLRRLDLNLVLSLDALLEERSVTRAAVRMGISQPSMSAALARLRRHFGDQLLARHGNEYRLTPLAARLREQVSRAIADLERVFDATAAFDPASTGREFTVLASDYALEVLGPPVAAILAAEAPGSRLRYSSMVSSSLDLPEQSLLGLDLILMPHGFLADMPHHDLFEDEWVILVAAENSAVGAALTVDHLRTLPWVVSYLGPVASTPAARQMRTLGIEPRVQMVTESFLAVPGLVAGSDRIALLQRRLADRLRPDLGVRALPCPIPVGPMVEAMWWHPLRDSDLEHAYLRDAVARAAAALR